MSTTPEYDRCTDRLKRHIDQVTAEISNDLWSICFHRLDQEDWISGDAAGAIAQKMVQAVQDDIKEALAK